MLPTGKPENKFVRFKTKLDLKSFVSVLSGGTAVCDEHRLIKPKKQGDKIIIVLDGKRLG